MIFWHEPKYIHSRVLKMSSVVVSSSDNLVKQHQKLVKKRKPRQASRQRVRTAGETTCDRLQYLLRCCSFLAVMLPMFAGRQPEEGPWRPALKKYPLKKCHKHNHRLNLEQAVFLMEYSVTKDATFCRHFLHSLSVLCVYGDA